ncbi:YpjP family protein [Bacillus taeanensis]|nr:YpjP family protein [Bacillus taeanensis]
MPLWLRKSIVVLITILTFGTVVPTSILLNDSDSKRSEVVAHSIDTKGDAVSENFIEEQLAQPEKQNNEAKLSESVSWNVIPKSFSEKEKLQNEFMTYTMSEAKKLAEIKFGPVINRRVGKQYEQEVLPKFGKVVTLLGEELEEEQIRHLKISQNPAGGLGEKILHIYDERNGQDIIRFHVRRDHPPLDGYWFNFHYHVPTDNFQTHHEIGKIYWDKNTPPHWSA